MATRRLLYLLGGSAAYEAFADEFVTASGGPYATIAVLAQTGEGWEEHKAKITQTWTRRGVTQYEPIVSREDGLLNLELASAVLRRATGIFIGGGHTPTYHRLFATEPVRTIIRDRYQDGIPVAGVSAGALISLEICHLRQDETGNDKLQVVQGLGLAKGFVIGVHFTERNALSQVLEVMSKTRTIMGLGIDEPACAVCENENFTKVLGRYVHRIEMTDFENMAYGITIAQEGTI